MSKQGGARARIVGVQFELASWSPSSHSHCCRHLADSDSHLATPLSARTVSLAPAPGSLARRRRQADLD
jgi:hypothetical protein